MSGDGSSPPEVAHLLAWAASAVERGRAEWPELAVSEEELARMAAARLAGPPAEKAGAGPDDLDAAELWIACACARGDALALERFRARYFDPVVPALRRMGLGDAQRDDVWQVLCVRLFVGEPGEPARIAQYAGTGRLSGLVKVAATRLALNWREQEKRRASGDDWVDKLGDGNPDPELLAMKRQHRDGLKEEIEAAIASLSARERMLLRLHLVEHLGIDPIAASCGVHRATAARWIAQAKERLAGRVHDRLTARWGVADDSLAALKAVIESQIDLSIERLLAD
jgi:RNA polymerase sigma-70 factor (ECF subfamily)